MLEDGNDYNFGRHSDPWVNHRGPIVYLGEATSPRKRELVLAGTYPAVVPSIPVLGGLLKLCWKMPLITVTGRHADPGVNNSGPIVYVGGATCLRTMAAGASWR